MHATPHSARRRLWLAGALVASQVACAHGAREIARGGVEGGLEGTLEALEDEDNRARLRRLLRDPEIQAAVHDLTQSITGGALDGLTDEERIQRVGEASDRYIRTISGALARAVGEDVSPAVTKSVKELVGAVMAGAIGPENRRLTREFVDGVTRTALSAFMQSTAQGLREELGPALGDVVTQDLGPAVQRVVEDNLGPALRTVLERDLGPTMLAVAGGEDGGAVGAFGRALSKQLVLGVNDGMSELGISLSPNKKASMGIFGWLAIGLGIVLLLVTILLVRELFGRRAQARERARSEELLLSILAAVQNPDPANPAGQPDFDTVVARARQHMAERDNAASYLAAMVERSKQLPHVAKKSSASKLLGG